MRPTGTTSAPCTRAATTAPGNHTAAAGGVEPRYLPFSVAALALLTGEWCIGILHAADGFKLSLAILADVLVNGHSFDLSDGFCLVKILSHSIMAVNFMRQNPWVFVISAPA